MFQIELPARTMETFVAKFKRRRFVEGHLAPDLPQAAVRLAAHRKDHRTLVDPDDVGFTRLEEIAAHIQAFSKDGTYEVRGNTLPNAGSLRLPSPPASQILKKPVGFLRIWDAALS